MRRIFFRKKNLDVVHWRMDFADTSILQFAHLRTNQFDEHFLK